jgi:hypothetical protein
MFAAHQAWGEEDWYAEKESLKDNCMKNITLEESLKDRKILHPAFFLKKTRQEGGLFIKPKREFYKVVCKSFSLLLYYLYNLLILIKSRLLFHLNPLPLLAPFISYPTNHKVLRNQCRRRPPTTSANVRPARPPSLHARPP